MQATGLPQLEKQFAPRSALPQQRQKPTPTFEISSTYQASFRLFFVNLVAKWRLRKFVRNNSRDMVSLRLLALTPVL